MKIGLLGGTFDPPHYGHLKIAKAAIEQLDLDEVILLPANKNPFKEGVRSALPKHRLEMANLLANEHPHLAVSDMEITRGGLSYTIDTLGELQMIQPGDYWFIMGADSLKSLPKWKNPERIMRICRIAAAVRPPVLRQDLGLGLPSHFQERIDMLEIEPSSESSTDIRNRISRGADVSDALPRSIIDYIKKNKLYA